MEKKLKFPNDFFWGSSTSSYQVEGGIDNSNWSKDFPAGVACDHYNRYEEDFDLLKSLNQNAYRFSIEWSRIEPEEGKFDQKEIEHYKKMILALKKRGIEPFVTLWHWTHPLWLEKKGGVFSNKFPYYFSRYAEQMVSFLGDDVKFWITINESESFATMSYLLGIWPPFKKNVFTFFSVMNSLIKSHINTYEIIKKKNPLAQVGVASNNNYYKADKNPISLIVKKVVALVDYFYILNRIKKYQDFIGLNYYLRVRVRGFSVIWETTGKKEKEPVSDVGWEIYPEGIYHVLKILNRYKKPIYITENGLADRQDKFRKNFLRDHLHWIHKAMSDGIDVKGYLHWSFMDNLEWHKGFEPEFGLVNIDWKTLARIPRPSAYYYAKICKNNELIINE